jgi:hypothetical protein
MQTFLPYENFKKTAQCLDNKRLNSQRREAFGAINILTIKEKNGYSNHPAVKMWKGYEEMLKLYFNTIIEEWTKRGYKNNLTLYNINENKLIKPWWLGNENFHRAMRSRLIEKNKEFYLPKFPEDEGFNNGKYLWPVNETKTFRVI